MSQYPLYSHVDPTNSNNKVPPPPPINMGLHPNYHPVMNPGIPLQQQPNMMPPGVQAGQYVYPMYQQQQQHQQQPTPPHAVQMMGYGYPQQHIPTPPQMQQQYGQPQQQPDQQQQQQQISREWEQIRIARQKLELLQEKIEVDQELLKQEKKQKRRQRQMATEELHKEWQQEMKLLQTRTQQIKDDYEAKLTAQSKEYEARLQGATTKSTEKTTAKDEDDNALEMERAKHMTAIQDLQKQHQEAMQKMESELAEERNKAVHTEETAKEHLQQELNSLKEKLQAQEQEQQQGYQARQQQWLDKLHEQEQKQQQRLEDLRHNLQKDCKVKCEAFQEELEEKSIAEQKSVESEYNQKLLAELASRQADHQRQLENLLEELQKRDDAIRELEAAKNQQSTTTSSAAADEAVELDQLKSQLAEKDDTILRLQNQMDDTQKQQGSSGKSSPIEEGDNKQAALVTSLKNKLAIRDEMIEDLKTKLAAIKETKDDDGVFQQTLAERDNTIQVLEGQIVELKEKHNQTCEDHQNELSSMAAKAVEKDDVIDRLKEEHAQKEQALTGTFGGKEAEFQEIVKEQDSILRQLEEQISVLTKERDIHLISDMDAMFLTTQLAEKEEAIGRLEAQLLEVEQAQREQTQSATAAGGSRLAEKEEVINRLELQLMEMERELGESKESTCRKCPALQEALETIQAKCHDLEHENKHADAADKLKMRKEMAQLLRMEEQFKAKIEVQGNQIAELKETNTTLAAQVEQGGKLHQRGSDSSGSHMRKRALIKNRNLVMEVGWRGSSTVDAGIYTGSVNDLGNPDGAGTLKFEDGSVYDGEFRDGNLHGEGCFAWVDGDTYHGEWSEGRQHGYGVFIWADGRLYQGFYKNGQRDGEGLMTWPYGARYRGEYQRDKRNGTGVYTYPDGRTYAGEYKDERPHGIGTETAHDGRIIFTGEWSMGEFLRENTEEI